MRWVIRIWPRPSADGLDPHLAPNAAMPSTDPRMARHGQARRGSHAIREWSMPSTDGMDPRLAPNSTNKEVFDAEAYAIHQALSTADQRQESDHRYTIFLHSTTSIERIRSDNISLGQRLADATIEACAKLVARDNGVTIRWVPAHQGALGNEVADECTKAAAEGENASDSVPDD